MVIPQGQKVFTRGYIVFPQGLILFPPGQIVFPQSNIIPARFASFLQVYLYNIAEMK